MIRLLLIGLGIGLVFGGIHITHLLHNHGFHGFWIGFLLPWSIISLGAVHMPLGPPRLIKYEKYK